MKQHALWNIDDEFHRIGCRRNDVTIVDAKHLPRRKPRVRPHAVFTSERCDLEPESRTDVSQCVTRPDNEIGHTANQATLRLLRVHHKCERGNARHHEARSSEHRRPVLEQPSTAHTNVL